MKTPKIDWSNKKNTEKVLNATGMTESIIENLISGSIGKAQQIAKLGVDMIGLIIDQDKDTWEATWNNNSNIITWFGKVDKANHVKDVYDKLDVVCNRFANKKQTIKIRDELPNNFAAQNLGGPLSPNTFKVAPAWIKGDSNYRAVTMIHESLHSWFNDQKIDGNSVYGSDMALELADTDPGKARRSPENYQWFCLKLQEFQEDLALKKSMAS